MTTSKVPVDPLMRERIANLIPKPTATRAIDELRMYLEIFVIEAMWAGEYQRPTPPIKDKRKQKPHPLPVRPERTRLLKRMERINPDRFKRCVAWFNEDVIRPPEPPRDPTKGKEKATDPPVAPSPPVAWNLFSLFFWLVQIAASLLYLLWPEPRRPSPTTQAVASAKATDFGANIFGHIKPTGRDQAVLDGIIHGSVVIEYREPELLSHKDLLRFVTCKTFPSFDTCWYGRNAFNREEWLWASIWDQCFHQQTPWFILSNGQDWVFGAFSEEWTTGFVSSVMRIECDGQLIIPWVVYWVASALSWPGTWRVPRIKEPPRPTTETLSVAYDLMGCNGNAAMSLSCMRS